MLKKLKTAELRPGMYVVDTGLSWMEHPFLYAEEGEISRGDITKLSGEGFTEAFVDTSQGSYAFENGAGTGVRSLADALAENGGSGASAAPAGPASLKEEFRQAERIYGDSIRFAKDFLKSAKLEKRVDYEAATRLVEDMIESVYRNADALVSLTKLRTHDEYTFSHCVNVAVLSLGFARFNMMPEKHLKPLGVAALFHDVGKALVPDEVLNKPGKLDTEEFEIMKRHPRDSYKLLKEERGVNRDILHGVAGHHEKINGQGYPLGLPDEKIHPYARIICVCDIYDALTSDRVYKPGIPATRAMKILYELRNQDIRESDVNRFIKFLGVYPVGSLVRLTDGAVGVVCESNPTCAHLPKVLEVFDSEMAELEERRVVDLAAEERRGGVAIETYIDPREAGVDVGAYLTG
jgi:HD-GYP domain-containing protein (c-di-GMP phosphodiesterase class II)